MKKSELRKLIKEEIQNIQSEGFDTDQGRRMDKIFNLIGYDDFHDFIQDNPGCIETIIDFIEQYFEKDLIQQDISIDELEDLGLYKIAEMKREEDIR
jgi:septin family protein